MNVRALQPLASAAAGRRAWRAGVHDGAGRAAAGAAGGDQRGEACGGAGAQATPADLRSLSAVQRGGGRSGAQRSRAAGREPVPDPGVRPHDEHAARRRRCRSRRARSGGQTTYLELNCALYIDPKTGNIYSLNNDTERHMTVWDRNAQGRCLADLEAADADGLVRPGGGRGARGAADHGAARTGRCRPIRRRRARTIRRPGCCRATRRCWPIRTASRSTPSRRCSSSPTSGNGHAAPELAPRAGIR